MKTKRQLLSEVLRPMIKKALAEAATTDDLVECDKTWRFVDNLDVGKLNANGVKVFVNPEEADMKKKYSERVYLQFKTTTMAGVAAVFNSQPDYMQLYAGYLVVSWD